MNHVFIDFTDCKPSLKVGTYGGMAGAKDAVVYQGNDWMIKYAGNTRNMQNVQISYTTAPLSEYFGSQIYKILGYDVHETVMGICNDRLVVGCKDFAPFSTPLLEIRTIKNYQNKTLAQQLEQSLSSTGDEHCSNLNELILHMKNNDILKKVQGLEERFWNMAVVDILIGNNDRNNGNWGVLLKDSHYELAPIYDNGASFYNKADETKMKRSLDNPNYWNNLAGGRTGFEYDGRQLTLGQFMQLDIPEFHAAIIRNVPLIIEKAPEIADVISSMPETFRDFEVCSKIRKEFYLQSLEHRTADLLVPAYNRMADTPIELNGRRLFLPE